MRSINPFEKFFNSSNDDDDVKFVIQKQAHLIQIHCESMIDSIKKCLLHDFVDDFEGITSSDWGNHRCIQTEIRLHFSYLTLWNVQFRGYSGDLLALFDVSQHDEADLVTEGGRHDTGTETGGKGSVYQKLQLMANLAVIGVLFRWFYDYLLILRIFSTFGGVCR